MLSTSIVIEFCTRALKTPPAIASLSSDGVNRGSEFVNQYVEALLGNVFNERCHRNRDRSAKREMS